MSTPTLEPTFITDTMPPKGESPTIEPTYLTYAPTAVGKKKVEPTIEPTYLTYAPTAVGKKKAEPTIEPTYLTYAPTETFPTIAPTLTHAPTLLTATVDPVGTESTPTIEPTYLTYAPTTKPTAEDSVEDSVSATGAEDRPTGKPTNPPTATPTKTPTIAPTMKPTNPGATIKQDKYRNKFVGFQSDWGPAHPGSMSYDFTRNAIYVSGTSFAPSQSKDTEVDFKRSTCFVGELPISDIERWTADDIPKPLRAKGDFVVPDSFDEREVMGCHAIYYDDESKSDDVLYVGTVTESDATIRNGLIHPGLSRYGRTRASPNWQLKADAFPLQNPTNPAETVDASPVRWPVAMASGISGTEDMLAVVTVSSNDPLLTEEYIENGDANNKKNYKNSLLPPGVSGGDPSKNAIPKRGSKFFMSYQRYTNTAAGLVFLSGEDLPATGKTGEIFPTGVANLTPSAEYLIMTGTMKGAAPRRFGMTNPVDASGEPRNDDYDGFVTGVSFRGTRADFQRERNVRFDSIEANPPLDDFAHGICMPPAGPDGTVKSYYVVGSSYGTMATGNDQDAITTNILSGVDQLEDGNKVNRLSAWVSKIDTRRKNDRSVVWTTQLFATLDNLSLEGGMTEAFGCHVIDQDKTKLYIGGTVYNGGTMDSNQKSGGGDDVWVAQLNSDDGSLRWIKQIGSSGDEKLARTNGIESDLNGHAIIYGETTGELYRKRRGETTKTTDGSSTDIFVTTLDMVSGASESTIEADNNTVKKDAIIGVSVTVVLLLLCIAGGFVMKWRRASRYAAKSSDGVMNLAAGETKKAFKDSTSSDGGDDVDDLALDEANGDASGGLSKFV